MYALLLVTIALIVYGSLYPWHFGFVHGAATPLESLLHSWPGVWNRWTVRDVILNLLLYFPLGLTACLAGTRRYSRAATWSSAVFLGLALSTAIEILQFYVPNRDTSLLDVLSNTAGTAAGATAALVFHPDLVRLTRRPLRHAAAGAFLLAAWVTCQLYPFFPVISQTRLRSALALLAHPSAVSVPEIWAVGAEWFAVALLLQTILGRMRLVWLAAAMLSMAARVFVVGRSLLLTDVLGAVLALLLWVVLREDLRLRAGALMLGSGLLLRELAPFALSTTPSAFSWIPFWATFSSERHSALVILARKAFDYGAAVWIVRALGLSFWRAGAAVAAALAVCEVVQCYLPGRTPEITDPVLALLMAFILWRLSDYAPRRGLA